MAWYEWIFSGAGVAVAAAVATSLTKRSRNPHKDSSTGNTAQDSSTKDNRLSIGDNQGLVAGRDIEQHAHHHYSAEGLEPKLNARNTSITAIPDVPEPRATAPSFSLHPTPREIEDRIDAVAPFMRPDVEKSYIGLDIEWPLELGTIQHLPESIPFTIEDRSYRHVIIARSRTGRKWGADGVNVLADLSKFPRFKSLQESAGFTVRGKIVSIMGAYPIVEVVDVVFE